MTTQHKTTNYIISSLNGHINDTPLSGFTKLNSKPGTIYTFVNANTHKTPEGLAFYREDDSLIIEHYGKKTVALKNFFSHKDNPAQFLVDNADGESKNIITADSAVIYENNRVHIIASEPLLVANSELTTNPVTPVDTTAEPEPDFLTDNWVWFAVGGAIILAGVAAGGSSSSSGKKDSSTDKPNPDEPDTGMPKLESIKATGNTITLTYNEALDGNNLPEASAFAIQVIGGATNPVTAVAISNSGDAIILTLTNPIAKGSNFTIAYTDPTTGDDTNAIQDEQGNDASTFNGKTGLVVDGYIQGAQLYADYNNNGIAEDDEILEGIITDEFGRFFLTTTDINAPLIAVGGTNIDTGIENTLTMRAPEGATVINPITTVVQQYLNDNEGTSLEQAETAVKGILGITLPANERLSDYEPISSKNQEMQEIAAQIVEVAMQAETTKSGDGSTVFENIAATKTPLDLTTADDVTAITKGTGITAETVQALVAQTTNIKDTDSIADITTQQKSLIVALTDDTGLEDDDLNSSVGTIEVTRKFTGDIQYSIDDGVIWTDDFDAEEGDNNLQVRQVDAEGKVLSAITTFDFIFDTKAPTVLITNNTAGTATGDVTYKFTFSEAVTGFTADDITVSGGSKGLFAQIDDITYQLVITPAFGSSIPIIVDVKADVVTDIAGNTNTAAEQSVQQVDTPEVGVSQVEISADTGVHDFDFTTNQASQTISAKLSQSLVTGEQLYGSVDGGTTWIDISEQATGIVISWDTSLIEGENSIAFKVGEDGVSTGMQVYVLDTQVPTQTVDSVAISDDTGIDGDLITKTTSQTITAKLSAVLETGKELLYGSVDGGTNWEDITDKATNTVISWETSLIEGEHSIVFKVADLAGNEADTSTPIDYALDTTAPTQTVDSVGFSDDSGSSESDLITNQESQTITAKLSAPLATGQMLYGSIDGGAHWTDITDKTTGTNISWDSVVSLIEGDNSIVFKITNVAGNLKETGFQNSVLDTSAPTQTVYNVNISADTGSSGSDFITNEKSQTITAKLSEILKMGDILSGSVDGTTWIDITNKVTNTAISWDVTLLEGKNSIVFKITDLAGNEGDTSAPIDCTLDTSVAIQTVDSVSFSKDTGSSESDFITNEKSQAITAKLSAVLATGDRLYGATANGQGWTDITDKVIGTAIIWETSLIEGKNSISFQITNLAGNHGNTSAPTEYELDTTAPTQTVGDVAFSDDSGSTTDFITNKQSQTITAKLSSALTTGEMLYSSVDGGTTWINITDKAIGTAISWDSVSLMEGENTIIFKITDLAGNDSVESGFQNYVLDTVAPTVIITDNIEGTATGDVTYNFAFSEAVTDFTVDDITISGGSKGQFSKIDDMTYRLVITPLAGSTTPIIVDVKAGVATDIAGNVNTAAVQSVQQVDTPILGVSAVTISEDTGSSESDFVTKTTAQTISARLNELLATGERLYGSVDGGAMWTELTDKVTGRDLSWDTSLVEGEHSIVFKITDPEGKDSAETGLQSYTLDTSAPTQTVNNVGVSEDTGIGGSDFITNESSQTITATLSASLKTGDILLGSVDGGTKWTDITDEVVNTEISWETSLIEGESSILFKVVDLAGNQGTNTGSQDYVLDTIAPTQTVDNVGFSGDAGSSDSTLTTGRQSQTIIAQLSGALATDDRLYGSVDGGAKWIDITDQVTGIAIRWDISLMDGENTIVFKITDWVDNDSAETGSKNYVLDTSSPTQTIDNVALSFDTGSSGTDFITKIAPQTIHAQLSAEIATGEILSGSVDGGTTWADITDKVTGTAISWDGATLIEGEYSIVFKISNQYGHTGANTGIKDYVLDTTAPTQTVYRVSINHDTGISSSDFITKTDSQTINAQLSKLLATGDTLYGSIDSGANWIDITDKVVNSNILWDNVILVEGSYEIVFKIRNLAGNETPNTGAKNYVLDTSVPTQTVGNVSFSEDTGSSDSDFITKTASQTITATLSAGLATDDRLYGTIDGGTNWIDLTDKVTDTAIIWDGAILSSNNSIAFRIVDLAGNEGETSTFIAYSLDTTIPTVAITDDTDGTATGAVTYSFKFSEEVTAFTAESIEVTGGVKGIFKTLEDNTYQLTVTPPDSSKTPITVAVKAGSAMDVAGNKLAATVAEAQDVLTGIKPTVDTSIVIFDLTAGKSSTHSDRIFTKTITDIYIIINPESPDVTLSAGNQWQGASDLASSTKLHLVSGMDGVTIKGAKNNPITSPTVLKTTSSSGSLLQLVTNDSLAGAIRLTGRLTRRHGISPTKWEGTKLWEGSFQMRATNVDVLSAMPAGLLTSQGLA